MFEQTEWNSWVRRFVDSKVLDIPSKIRALDQLVAQYRQANAEMQKVPGYAQAFAGFVKYVEDVKAQLRAEPLGPFKQTAPAGAARAAG